MTPDIQLSRFKAGIELLGGTRSAARDLGITERTVNRLLAGQSKVHAGFLEDLARALVDHADACRKLERLISPAFAENLTADQRQGKPHGNAHQPRRED